MTTLIYTLEFKQMLEKAFSVQSEFTSLFGEIQTLDGVQDNESAFVVKSFDVPTVINTYTDKEIDKVVGDVVNNEYGPATVVAFENQSVNYRWNWSIHEILKNFKINATMSEALASRIRSAAEAKITRFNQEQAGFISTSAGKSMVVTDYSEASVAKLFNDLTAYYINKGARGRKIAKVNTSMYLAIMDHPLTVGSKRSTVDIDNGSVTMFKGFEIEVLADNLFVTNEVIYTYIAGIGKAFTGFDELVAKESEFFSGYRLVGAGKAGEFVPDVNKPAIVKVTLTPGV